MTRALALCLLLAGCATPREHLTRQQLDAGIEACRKDMGGTIEITASQDGHSALVACVWR